MLRLVLCGLPLLAMLGCGDDTKEDDDDDNDDDVGLNLEDSGAAAEADPDAPVISAVDAWCYEHSTGQARTIWVVSVRVDDPQGTETIESFFDGVTVFEGSTELFQEALTCVDGDCTGTWNEEYEGDDDSFVVSCASASDYTIQVVVEDEDGNLSLPAEVVGRQGTSASG